ALLLCGLVLVLALKTLRRGFPDARPLRARSTGDARQRTPGTLARLEQEVALGIASSFDLHHRLRPRLRALVQELLEARRGVSLEREPEQARDLVGAETWELVRPDRPPPEDRLGRGLPVSALARIVESVERI